MEKGRASAMMCSYNAVNGVPSCANSFLMTTIARNEWSLDGYITSDCGAVSNIPQTHYYTNSSVATFGATLPSGMDIGCDVLLVQAGVAAQAVAAGVVAQADIDKAVSHLLRVRMRLGEFDPPAAQPYAQIGLDVVCSPEHVALARDSARQSLVLLTNPRQLLPLNRSAVHSVAVVGPFANSSAGINGGINYAGIPCGGAATTVADAFAASGLATTFALGCDIACASTAGFAAATAAAANADATIVVVGLDESIEDEALDRTYLTLPGNQQSLVEAACAAARGPCVVALMSGGAVDLSGALPSVSGGVLYAGFMGGSGAPAFVDTVFGASAPAGRLSQTFYPSRFVDDVSMFEMKMAPGDSAFPPGSTPGRGNRFYTGEIVHPFGWGLTYTSWQVSVAGPPTVPLAAARAFLAANPAHGARFASRRSEPPSVATYTVNVTNVGRVDSDYVVLGFLVPPGAGAGGVPQQQLFGFERVHVRVGETVTVWLGVGARDLTRVVAAAGGEPARRVAVAGEYGLRVGVRGEPGGGGAEARFVAVD